MGVVDLSFLGSKDFQLFLKESKSISFAMYSPLAWKLGYRQFGFSKRRIHGKDEIAESMLVNFCKRRFQGVERSDISQLRANLKIGVDNGRILLVRNQFFRHYWELHNLLYTESEGIRHLAVRDLSNILLASQMQLPLWLEKNANSWIEENYKFLTKKKSDLITLPFILENPRFDLRDALARLNALFNQRISFENMVTKLKQDLRRATEIAFQTKGIMLSILEPLPLWDELELTQRYSISAILTIIDVLGVRRIRERIK